MTDETARGRQKLGRGLSALLGEEREDYSSLDSIRQTKTVPIGQLVANPLQPRRSFDEDELQALADSIEVHGVLQPILVRRDPGNSNGFEIVAGERRWRAAQRAHLHDVPVVIKELTDSNALEIALVENIQRQDLNAIEEAQGYQQLIDGFQHRQEDLGKLVGKSRSHIANTLRLLNLPSDVKNLVVEGRLTAGHARALLTTKRPSELAQEVVAKGLNVRQTEKISKKEGGKGRAKLPAKDADTVALERDLSELLGLKVSIDFRGQGGNLVIHYASFEQLDDVLNRLRG